jgi:deoxyribodipyrimidine photolyase-related protein
MFMGWVYLVMWDFCDKPYICGSAYFMKMMDFKKGDWCITMDGLYWRFIDRNRKFF